MPTIILLEPDALQRDLVQLALTRNQFSVVVCKNSEDLRTLLEQYRPEFLLIDTFLPGDNGLDLLEALVKEKRLAGVKVFLVSAFGFPEVVHKAASLGAADFFVKPLDTELVVERISRHINKP
jgi:twitching motility two-component system response regulator PilH/two-component system nitrogen regulation response regulator NtrX